MAIVPVERTTQNAEVFRLPRFRARLQLSLSPNSKSSGKKSSDRRRRVVYGPPEGCCCGGGPWRTRLRLWEELGRSGPSPQRSTNIW